MQRLDRILLLRLLAIFGLILTVVTLSAVLSQAARLTDEVLRAGMSLSEFGGLILLIVPKMAELVTPLASVSRSSSPVFSATRPARRCCCVLRAVRPGSTQP